MIDMIDETQEERVDRRVGVLVGAAKSDNDPLYYLAFRLAVLEERTLEIADWVRRDRASCET